MKRHAGLVFALCLLASPAFAGGDVCILNGASPLVLSKPKLPKARASTPLHGFLDIANTPPVHGTFTRGTTGTLVAGFTVQFADGVACFAHVTIDETFDGSGKLRCTNNLADEIALVWTRIDC